MGLYAELYQKLVTLPNAPPKEQDEYLVSLLAQMKALGDDAGTFRQLFEEGKREYLDLLLRRGRHHLDQGRAYNDRVLSLKVTVAPHEGTAEQELRDFYHHIYYAVFYISRYLLVLHGYPDRSSHEKIPQLLDKIGRSDQTPNEISILFSRGHGLLN